MTTKKSAEFDRRKRACVVITERIYESVGKPILHAFHSITYVSSTVDFGLLECPKDPIVTKSECGHFGSDVGGVSAKSDPNLLFRRVETAFRHLKNCECVLSRRWEFEACGCREMHQSTVHECHEVEGILISYQQNFVLSVAGSNQTYSGSEAVGKTFGQLEQAKCTPIFSGQTITKISKDIFAFE